MQTTSATWKALWSGGNARLETKAIIAGVEYTDISAPAISRAAMQGGLGIGNAVSASLSLAVRTTDDIPKSAQIDILMRLTDGTTASEWLPAGTFYISKRARDPVAGIQSFECYDALLKGNAALDEVPWVTENGEPITAEDGTPIMFSAFYPRDMASLVTDIVVVLGVELDARTVVNTGAEYVVDDPAAGATIRDLLGTIAAAHGGNWIITPEGKLRLVPVVSAGGAAAAAENVVDVAGKVGGIAVGDAAIISGVRYTAGEAEPVLIGDETGVIIDVGLSYALAHNLAQALIGTSYQPYTMAGAIYDPAVELGDYVRSGADVSSVLYSETVTLGSAVRGDIAAPEPSEIADEYPFLGGSARALTLAKAYAREAVEALDGDLTQQEIFNRLTDNGAEQGLILYNGKLYLNASYISAGTVSADILKGGVLKLGGENNVNGVMQVLDADGDTIMQADQTGLSVYKGEISGPYIILGGANNEDGTLRVNDESANVAAEITNDGIYSYTSDGSVRSVQNTGGFMIQGYSEYPPIGWRDILKLAIDSSKASINSGARPLNIHGQKTIDLSNKEGGTDNAYATASMTDDVVDIAVTDRDVGTTELKMDSDNGLVVSRTTNGTTPGTPNPSKLTFDTRMTLNVPIYAPSIYPTNGASGTFTTADGKTVTVTNGIITNIA